jgi:hypothetical protein
MQTNKFLGNVFTKGLEIHSSFFVFFQMFLKKIKIKSSNLKILNFSYLKNHQISNLKNHRILNWLKKIDPIVSKSTSPCAFRTVLRKNNFLSKFLKKANQFNSAFALKKDKKAEPNPL